MRTSWAIGITAFYLLILGLEMLLTNGAAFSATDQTTLKYLMSPIFTNLSGETSAIFGVVLWVANFFSMLVKVIFLYAPTVWSGYLQYVWFYICLPVSIGMIVSVVSLLRGSGAS